MASGLIPVPKRTLTPAQYGDLAAVPPEVEWLANITNKKTRRAYKRRRCGILILQRTE
jgi:integrase/recombinase XerD